MEDKLETNVRVDSHIHRSAKLWAVGNGLNINHVVGAALTVAMRDATFALEVIQEARKQAEARAALRGQTKQQTE